MRKAGKDVIVARLSQDFGLSKKESEEMVKLVTKTFRNLLMDGYNVSLSGLAEIKVNKRIVNTHNVNTRQLETGVMRLVPSIRLAKSFKRDYKKSREVKDLF